MSKVRRKTHADGIGYRREHDRYLRSRICGGARRLWSNSYNKIGLRLRQFGGQSRELVEARKCFLAVGDDVGTFHPTELVKLFPKRIHVGRGARSNAEHSDASYLLRGMG